MTHRPRLAILGVLGLALAATLPTLGDFGLIWDEPAYRYSQLLSTQWWEQLARVRSWADFAPLLDADALLYYWPYGRHGINFHPPLAGQLNLLTHALTGGFLKDIPSRRLSSAIELSLTATFLFGFLARRTGACSGLVAAAALLLIPRVYGQGHLAETDTPGLLLWVSTAFAVWKGLNEPRAGRWRMLVGVLLGLAFVEKMGAVVVLLPTFAWLILGRLPRSFRDRGAWTDGVLSTAAIAAPLVVALLEVRRLSKLLPPPQRTNLYVDKPAALIPGAILALPALIWLLRRLLGRLRRGHPTWGTERPALETWEAVLGLAPLVGWLGNPAWWRETLPRLAHYEALSFARRGTLPDIQILYWGQTYVYSLPWHNAWVLMAITVPASLLLASLLGLITRGFGLGRDPLPRYFLMHLAALPALRMLPTPAHDGVRLFLPSFAFLAAFAGWGVSDLGAWAGRVSKIKALWARLFLSTLALGPAALQLIRVHPFELSYYNEFIGGARGAWARGFELSCWYDAFDRTTLGEINALLPPGASITFANDLSTPPTFKELQDLGQIRSDIDLGEKPGELKYRWLLTHDSKASADTRLLFAMRPWYARRPRQLDGLRVATVADPIAASRARALQLLCDAADTSTPEPPAAPSWIRRYLPPLSRLWGDGVTKSKKLGLNEAVFNRAKADPRGLRAAARALADGKSPPDPDLAAWLRGQLARYDRPGASFADLLMGSRPEALPEAVEMLIRRPEAIRAVLRRYAYTDPESVGGYLDESLK